MSSNFGHYFAWRQLPILGSGQRPTMAAAYVASGNADHCSRHLPVISRQQPTSSSERCLPGSD
jgi:hypothetical protein